jgi:hypothetical protein
LEKILCMISIFSYLLWFVLGCKKNDLFYQNICYPLRLLKNSSGCHLRWLACLKGPCFFFRISV